MVRERAVRAIVYCDGKVLAVRHDGGADGGCWEFPGGAIREGETAEEACRRSFSEEQGIGLHVLWRLDTLEADLPDRPLSMDVLIAPLEGACLRIPDDNDRRWLSQDQLLEVDWSAADAELIMMIGVLWDQLFADEHL
ncbi:NUDIX domain-containing protein [Coriobacteriales bacterium OH1046]|nr:NUDIX domain-containing protein [Coriobacteriales bacterium OH1046]